jgi:Fe-S-cluster-containing hydrogenase component 2/CRP-like cAMP-binding protein
MSDIANQLNLGTAQDESPFSRDLNGFLVRLDAPTAKQYSETVSLTIDGQPVEINKAVPTTDAQGQLVYQDGETIPRATTIYDAACKIRIEIPILCHQHHQRPVAVCRICSVYLTHPDALKPKLVPACQHPVGNGMVVHTAESTSPNHEGKLVRDVVATLVNLLNSDQPNDARSSDELNALAQRFNVHQENRRPFPAPRPRPPESKRRIDDSSHLITVDHSACILCDRCIRGCNEVRGNFVIGRNGKGYNARIGFDLGGWMADSSCVSCGECMISCPTGALTLKTSDRSEQGEVCEAGVAQDNSQHHAIQQPPRKGPGKVEGPIPVDELLRSPLSALFAGIPRKFLEWNEGAVYRRTLSHKEVLVREGEYGTHAVVLEQGTLKVVVEALQERFQKGRAKGAAGLLGRSILSALSLVQNRPNKPEGNDLESSVPYRLMPRTIKAREGELHLELIGESACLNNYAHEATVSAIGTAVVLEIQRNLVLHMLRNPRRREKIVEDYRTGIADSYELLYPLLLRLGLSPGKELRGAESLSLDESQQTAHQLAQEFDFVQVDPEQPIFTQNDPADHCYLVRVGFVRVAQGSGKQEAVLDYFGPGGVIGALELVEKLKGRPTRHRHTCTALDHVELVKIPGDAFLELIKSNTKIRTALEEAAKDLTKHLDKQQKQGSGPLEAYLEQGLYQARSLLVLDLERCTRCDECTRACADTHQGVTRLIREGLRFDKYLVATACRSCLDPRCLVGCPVDAIHRNGLTREIKIESYCVGCELCAKNCPYGNIHMAERSPPIATLSKTTATTCDLCHNQNPYSGPSCVYACPHDAAHRMNGGELLKLVQASHAAAAARNQS